MARRIRSSARRCRFINFSSSLRMVSSPAVICSLLPWLIEAVDRRRVV